MPCTTTPLLAPLLCSQQCCDPVALLSSPIAMLRSQCWEWGWAAGLTQLPSCRRICAGRHPSQPRSEGRSDPAGHPPHTRGRGFAAHFLWCHSPLLCSPIPVGWQPCERVTAVSPLSHCTQHAGAASPSPCVPDPLLPATPPLPPPVACFVFFSPHLLF